MNEAVTHLIDTDLLLIEGSIVLLGTLIVDRIRHIILNRVERKLEPTQSIWGKSVVKAIRRPAAILIWAVGLLHVFEGVLLYYSVITFDSLTEVRHVKFIAIFTWFVYKLIGVYESVYLEVKRAGDIKVDITAIKIAVKLLRITAVILGTLVAMHTIGLNIAGILAFGGIGGIAIGFAAKEMISNYFGALMIFMDRPFKVGETINSTDRDIRGTVADIGWRQTIIERFDTRTLYVPNSVFSSISVQNFTRQTNRRIYEYVGIRYEDSKQLENILAATRKMIREHSGIDQNNSVLVNFDRFAPSSLDIFIYCFTKTVNWSEYHDVKEDILIKTIQVIEDHGAEIAFPTSTIHLKQGEMPPPAADLSDNEQN